ncbi:Methionine--tRNA ligase [Candidatus Calditenuaceae archaeon HR02]|nr:Methionine--tRNA ligase [Candidatus Calditenuaceae archaeon HR02]
MSLPEIDITEFKRVEMRVGKVVKAERVPATDRLLRLEVDFGGQRKQAITGLGHLYSPEHFEGRLYVFVTNLKPRKVRGLVSECMILAAMTSEENIVPIAPEAEIEPGAGVQ